MIDEEAMEKRRLLLTPGPLNTSARTRAALNRDWGSRDGAFLALSESLRTRLAALAGVMETHVTVPMQGSGTFAVEAAIGTLVPRAGRLLVLVNGAYGRRIAEIADRLGRLGGVLEVAEDQAIDPLAVAQALAADRSLTDVAVVHCETTTGLLNPLAAIAEVVRGAGRRLLVDAMSSFGAIPIDGKDSVFTAIIGSANKGLEGVPGLSFVIAETRHLNTCRGNAVSLSLDLWDQWRGLSQSGQWRFTPPVQIVAALAAALDQLDEEGGIAARHRRYRANCDILLRGMLALGFVPYIDASLQAPIIVTFREPPGGWFDFQAMYDVLAERGVVIYPGKLTREPSFRIGCIGHIDGDDMQRAVAEIGVFMASHDRHNAAC